MARPKVYADTAERMQAYRERLRRKRLIEEREALRARQMRCAHTIGRFRHSAGGTLYLLECAECGAQVRIDPRSRVLETQYALPIT